MLDCECRQPGSDERFGEHFNGVHIYEALEIYQIHQLERFFQRVLDQDPLDQDPLDQDPLDQDPLNQDPLNQHQENAETVSLHSISCS
ncbi:MAG: hypothetical protein V4671_28955 [Armatimonadota bacterium]